MTTTTTTPSFSAISESIAHTSTEEVLVSAVYCLSIEGAMEYAEGYKEDGITVSEATFKAICKELVEEAINDIRTINHAPDEKPFLPVLDRLDENHLEAFIAIIEADARIVFTESNALAE